MSAPLCISTGRSSRRARTSTHGRADAAPWTPGTTRVVSTRVYQPLAGTPAVRIVPAHLYKAAPVSLLKLPISPRQLLTQIILPALKLLPAAMNSIEALVMLVAIALQESNLEHRWQVIDPKHPGKKGPARGLWQFELGTKASKGGVWGVYLHPSSRYWLAQVCAARGVAFEPRAIWLALETDDLLACCVARLLLFTDPKKLPSISDVMGAWTLYRVRTWRPGKPHQEKWADNHAAAALAVQDIGVAA